MRRSSREKALFVGGSAAESVDEEAEKVANQRDQQDPIICELGDIC